ncbi:MAG: Capsule polysaccharide export protein [Nitrospira sp.]|nr:MAG: Capsule polysaccharide export protein [Nitrospira sp.]
MNRRAPRSTWAIGRMLVSALLIAVAGCGHGLSSEIIEEANSAQKDFLLGPEDVLEIAVWRNQDLTQKEEIIRPDGKISMPLIGEVVASGRTANQLAAHITERLKEFKENPSVTVRVKEVNSYYVYVLGSVTKPGKYQLKSHATVLQAVAVAGGFAPYAGWNKIQVLRTVVTPDGKSKEMRIPVRYDDLMSGDGEIRNFQLKTGDVVVVP